MEDIPRVPSLKGLNEICSMKLSPSTWISLVFAPDYGADVMLVDTHNPARHRFPGPLHLTLLGKYLPDDVTSLMIEPVQCQLFPVLFLDDIKLSVKLSLQVNQGSAQFLFLLPGLFAATAEVLVAFADLIILAAGTADLQSPRQVHYPPICPFDGLP